MESKLIDTIIATGAAIGAAIGAVVITLKKLSLISFGKQKVESVKTTECKECSAHPDIVKKMNGVKEQQTINTKLLEQHTENHRDSKEELKIIKSSLRIIGENIAVLKDRSDREEKRLNRVIDKGL